MEEFTHYIIEIFVVIFSLCAFYLFKNYWPKYFESKATNQATKEDIGEITAIVENIKSDLSQQNEFLKAQLSLTNQHQLNIKSAEREAIFDFNKRKSVWIYSLIRFSFFKYGLENYKEIYNLTYLEYQDRQFEYELAAAHLALFIHDDEFASLKEKLIAEVLGLHNMVISTIYSIYPVFAEGELSIKDKPAEEKRIRYDMIEELLTLQRKFKETTDRQFEKVNVLDIQMRDLLCNRLKILEKATSTSS